MAGGTTPVGPGFCGNGAGGGGGLGAGGGELGCAFTARGLVWRGEDLIVWLVSCWSVSIVNGSGLEEGEVQVGVWPDVKKLSFRKPNCCDPSSMRRLLLSLEPPSFIKSSLNSLNAPLARDEVAH